MSSSTLERGARTAERGRSGAARTFGPSASKTGASKTGASKTGAPAKAASTTGASTRAAPTKAAPTRAAPTKAAPAKASPTKAASTTGAAKPGARTGRAGASGTRATSRPAASRTRTRVQEPTDTSGGTAPFVLLIMVLLTSGLVATLWLSTAAAADSYRLDDARQATRDRTEQVERLHRDVAAMQSAPALAAAAERIGMVPAGVPAVILVHPDGTSQVVGTPEKAHAASPPPAPAAAPADPANPATTPAGTGGAPDPEALANDPRSGVQSSRGGAPAPAPAGAGAAGTTGATRPGTATDSTTTDPSAATNPTTLATGPTTAVTSGGR